MNIFDPSVKRDEVFKKNNDVYEEHPEGTFDGYISKSEVKNHPVQGEYITLHIKTSEGMAFSSLFLMSPTDTAKRIAKENLQKIILGAYSAGVELKPIDSMREAALALEDLPVRVYVKHKPYNGKMKANVYFNDVPEEDKLKEVKPVNKSGGLNL